MKNQDCGGPPRWRQAGRAHERFERVTIPSVRGPLWPRPARGTTRARSNGDRRRDCRRNFLVPMPRFRNFDDLNTHLEACCAKRWAEQLRGHDQTVGERLERDRAVLQRLPAAWRRLHKPPSPGPTVRSSLVRYRGTDYSVPTRFGHCEVLSPSAIMSTRWSSVAPQSCAAGTRVHTSKRTSSSIRCTICPCWSKRPTRWIWLPWPAGCCRRCWRSPPPT